MSVKRKVAYYLYNNDAAPICAFIGSRTKFGKGSSASNFSLQVSTTFPTFIPRPYLASSTTNSPPIVLLILLPLVRHYYYLAICAITFLVNTNMY
jgi:hypothetical protein